MPDLIRKPKVLISATVATARYFPSDDMSTDVIGSSPCAGHQISHRKGFGGKTDLKSDFGKKSPALSIVDHRKRIFSHMPL